jgi:peroxiredoxin
VLKPGEKARDFELPDQNGNPVKLSDLLTGEAVVLYFYPRADTGINSARPPHPQWVASLASAK